MNDVVTFEAGIYEDTPGEKMREGGGGSWSIQVALMPDAGETPPYHAAFVFGTEEDAKLALPVLESFVGYFNDSPRLQGNLAPGVFAAWEQAASEATADDASHPPIPAQPWYKALIGTMGTLTSYLQQEDTPSGSGGGSHAADVTGAQWHQPIDKALAEAHESRAHFRKYQKQALTEAIRMSGPFTVETTEGPLTCEDGWLAIDARGFPYPIDAEEFDLIYKQVEG